MSCETCVPAAHAKRKLSSEHSGQSSGEASTIGRTDLSHMTRVAPIKSPLPSRSPESSSYTPVPRSASS